uniref:HEAT repeat-containing protein 5B-like n=1 Tax=Saccoglossus kowalevskii TaxID=10224 RepID=A0ABM0M2L9_SACKO|nr:PREDICTED: HEAT repeat-containing protein 5B-like [Saccoglossus kowalevskii]
MELSHSLLLNEEALLQIAASKKPVFIFEWLRFLDKVLVAAQKSDIKESQNKLVQQLTNQIHESPGPPTRKLLGKCLATLYHVGDTFTLFETVNKCNDIVKSKDDSPSFLPAKLAAVACIGAMYEKLGRMVGGTFPENIQNLVKGLKNAESQGRSEIMLCLQKILAGLGTVAQSYHKEIYKAARNALVDRSMAVRCASTKCILELIKWAPFIYTTELENLASQCFRALDSSNYDVRCAVAKVLGVLMATSQTNRSPDPKVKKTSTEEVLNILASGFLKGGSGFLKGGGGELLKGGTVNREIRVGVTQAYVIFVNTMGGLWFERNITTVLNHVLELVAHPRASPSHVDAVYARKCVSFILRSLLGGMIGEKAQMSAAKEICVIITKQMNLVSDDSLESTDSKSGNNEIALSQHVLVCALQELGSLVKGLGTCANNLVAEAASGIVEPVVSVLLHPAPSARLGAAWCLRCIAVALPSQLTILLDRCTDRINSLKASPEAVSGYSFALAALLGGVHESALGIPHAKGKAIFNIGEDLLRTASQNSRMSLHRTQAGWLILGAVMTLGASVVRQHLPKMLLLWRNAFPRSAKELDSEKARGDAFTWQVTLEGRAGALCTMRSFILHCSELVTDDVIRRLMTPLDCAMSMMANIPGVIKMYGAHLKACAAMVRLRLYETLALLPPQSYEGSLSSLLRELVAEFTLTDNPANTTTSTLRSMCHVDDSIILQSWLQETDHKSIEMQLQPNSASGSGALEHDPSSIYLRIAVGDAVPGPLPLGVAVIDASVILFGKVFSRVAHKHRLQMLEHFGECIKQAKSTRQQAVQINIFTAVLSALKGLAEAKGRLKNADVQRAANNLIMSALTNSNPILRCAAGEAVGRMAQVIADSSFIAQTAQNCFDRLKTARDVVSRTGNSLALGCLHRYVGGMGAGHHLNTSVSILLALAQDITSPQVQVWSLHALALIADSGGPMFRGYVEPTLSLCLQLLLTVPPATVEVHQCLGRCLAALITTLGPELQANTITLSTCRSSCLVGCAIMQDHPDSLVGAEAIACLQQLHMFAPRHVNLSTLVPHLCKTLKSPHLLLRLSAVACLRQLSQREAREVCEHAMTLVVESNNKQPSMGKDNSDDNDSITMTETGLEGVLFEMLDKENDSKLRSDIHDTLISMLQELAAENSTHWMILCKDVLQQASTDSKATTPAIEEPTDPDKDEKEVEQMGESEQAFKILGAVVTHPTVAPRWPTRVFATECVRRIISVCDGNTVHFNLALAREMKSRTAKGDYLVLHLSDLVRMAFMAATSESDQLRKEGLRLLQDVINKFAKVPEPEFPGHFILEQFQAQVSAALRPAFSPDTPPDVTAMACQVSSTWIGSGVALTLNDLRRVHQLLVSSLAKLKTGNKGAPSMLYSESATTMEKLAVLKAWAEVYIVAMQQNQTPPSQSQLSDMNGDFDEEKPTESLLTLVQPELASLSKHWLAALRDHALLSLPQEYSSQLPPEGGAFYNAETMENARPHYRNSWPPMLYAAALWLNDRGFANVEKEKKDKRSNSFGNNDGTRVMTGRGGASVMAEAEKTPEEINSDRFHLIQSICVEALCNPRSSEPIETVSMCLKALHAMLDTPWPRTKLGKDQALAIELLNVLHRLLLTRDMPITQLAVMDVVKQVIIAMEENLEQMKAEKKQGGDGCKDVILGEGGENGDIIPGQSLVFAVLEVCLCVLIRQLPALNPSMPSTHIHVVSNLQLSEESNQLVSRAVSVMAKLPDLCSAAGSVSILPTILFLTTGVIRETSLISMSDYSVPLPVAASLQSLKLLTSSPYTQNSHCSDDWIALLRSALATLLDFVKPGVDTKEKNKTDECCIMLAVAMFIMTAPSSVSTVPSIQSECIELFVRAFKSDRQVVRIKCLQTLASIIQHPQREVSTPFIHALGPKIVEYLHQVGSNKAAHEDQFTVVIEALKGLENLVALTDETYRIQLAALLVPTLISFLLDSNTLPSATKFGHSLHDYSLQRLMKIGPQYPTVFKTIMNTAPDLKSKLEAAVRANQATAKKAAALAAAHKPKVLQQPAQPSIKLKTNFSNFTG